MEKPPTPLYPMRIGEILDRSLKLLPRIIFNRFVLISYLFLAGLNTGFQVFQSHAQKSGSLRTAAFASLGSFALTIAISIAYLYIQVLVTLMSSSLWLTNELNAERFRAEVSLRLVVRMFVLQWRIAFVAMFWTLFLIVPGIVYGCNRILAYPIMILEKATVRDSLKRSRDLMNFYPNMHWYSFGTPLMRISGILLLLLVIGFMPGMLMGASVFSAIKHGAQLTFLETPDIILLFASQLLTALAQALTGLVYVSFYYDLRVRSEGYDLELQLRETLPETQAALT